MARPHPHAVPLTEAWDWQLRAACRDADPGLFFSLERERGRARDERLARAKQLCDRCPVARACLEQATALREEYGVWGGRSEEERGVRH